MLTWHGVWLLWLNSDVLAFLSPQIHVTEKEAFMRELNTIINALSYAGILIACARIFLIKC